MNFLGHSLISIEIDESTDKNTLYANFTGDYYKGLVDRIELPEALKKGITLHRTIDKISDRKENGCIINGVDRRNFYQCHFLIKKS